MPRPDTIAPTEPPAAVSSAMEEAIEAGRQRSSYWIQYFHGLSRQIEELRQNFNERCDKLQAEIRNQSRRQGDE